MDFTNLILSNSYWFLGGLGLYYLLSFIKVHLIWQIQPRIYNPKFDLALFRRYHQSLLVSFVKPSFHLGSLHYILGFNKSKFPIQDDSRLNALNRYLRILKSFTDFIKIYLIFAFIFSLLRYFIEKRFYYDELQITLGEIQKLLNDLEGYGPFRVLFDNKNLVILLFVCFLIFAPFFKENKLLRRRIKKYLSAIFIAISILLNVSFFGTQVGKDVHQKDKGLKQLRLEIIAVHYNVFKEVFIPVVDAGIGEALIKESNDINLEIERFRKKISSVDNLSLNTSLKRELKDSLNWRLEQIEKWGFRLQKLSGVGIQKYLASPTDLKFHNFFKSETRSKNTPKEDSKKTEKRTARTKEYFENPRTWSKKKGKSILSKIRKLTRSKGKTKSHGKFKEVLEGFFDYAIGQTLDGTFDFFDLNSQKTLKKLSGILFKENIKEKLVQNILGFLNSLQNLEFNDGDAILTNYYEFSAINIVDLKNQNDYYYKTQSDIVRKKQKIINEANRKKIAVTKLKNQITNQIQIIFRENNHDYNPDYVENYKELSDLIFEEISTDSQSKNSLNSFELERIISESVILRERIRLRLRTIPFGKHPFPRIGCPLCIIQGL